MACGYNNYTAQVAITTQLLHTVQPSPIHSEQSLLSGRVLWKMAGKFKPT